MERLTSAQERGLRLAYLIIGIAVPLIGWSVWNWRKNKQKLRETDKVLDETGEESFPASDPPAAW